MKNGKIFVIGLCGTIGSGKSYVCSAFKKVGIPTVDTDAVYKDISGPGSEIANGIKDAFGSGVITPDGNIDRKALSEIVFSDKKKLEILNSVTHGKVIEKTLSIIKDFDSEGKEFIVVEVPLMFESGFDKFCDGLVCVCCTVEKKLERIIKRDKCTRSEAKQRIDKQHDDYFYRENCDFHIENNDIENVEEQVFECIKYFKRRYGTMCKLKEKLTYSPKSIYENAYSEKKAEIFDYAERYKKFIDSSKTEREAVKYAIKAAEAKGFRSYDFGDKIVSGGKYYYNNRGKSIFLFVIGSEPTENGVRISAAHIDSPRVDLKQRPLYEDSGMAFFKTHYYGGIKKYQWTAIPLALHGTVCLADGSSVDICIGEDESEPVFYIDDLLPHLAGDQMAKRASDVISGETLNLLIGSEPYEEEGADEKIKLNVLKILNDKYGITEADFLSAELCAVPAFKARDIGFDRSLIGAYGHDDRVCAYPALTAIIEAETPKATLMTVLADKEEIGSEGNSGMQCEVFLDLLREIAGSTGANFSKLKANSVCLSADVNAAFDPNFADVYEKRNSSFINRGVVLTKYTGARGKGGTSDASAEFVGRVRNVFDKEGVIWQTGELGKVDVGGGGTVAKYIAKYNIDVVDLGVAVISMHAPYEVISKGDLYNTYLGIKAFYEF